MSAPEKIHLWQELAGYSRNLKGVCDDVVKRNVELEQGSCTIQIQQAVRHFREAYALLHLLRRESNLLGGLIDHDFLNRFAAINIYLEIGSKKLTHEILNIICDTTWIFSEVVESLIFWIDHQDVILRKTQLDSYIQFVRKSLARTFREIDLSAHLVDQDLPVLLHSGTISNLLINMIVNAIKHGEAKRVELVSRKEGDKAQLIIRDDGKGLEVPFPQIVPGLGLLKIQERLSLMNATFEVDEHGGIGGGAAFRIHFPIAQSAPSQVRVEILKVDEGCV